MIIPLNKIKINNNFIFTINILINGIKSELLFDTGSSFSIIDIKKLNKFTNKKPTKTSFINGINESVDNYQIYINNIKIGNMQKENVLFNTIDLTTLNNTFSFNYLKPIDGIFGNNLINNYIKSINIIDSNILI